MEIGPGSFEIEDAWKKDQSDDFVAARRIAQAGMRSEDIDLVNLGIAKALIIAKKNYGPEGTVSLMKTGLIDMLGLGQSPQRKNE